MMKCTVCGRDGQTLTTYFNVSTMTASYICSRCQAKEAARHVMTPEALDEMITEYETLAEQVEKLIVDRPEMPEVPKALASIAFTPLSMYQGIQSALAELKSRRMELITQADSEARLKYDLKRALENEEYERSAEIRDKLNELANAGGKTAEKRVPRKAKTESEK